ncbi:MAG: VOC family protein [Defluviitaleaceae bacterium]|nr:VOC family protein [Defluviitaleaceae bacterium]
MIGVEIDFVVSDSLKALPLYESIFEVERVEVTNFEPGKNEAVFNMYGTRFHMLDEVEEIGMVAPRPDSPLSMWVNIVVPDIKSTYEKAITAGCKEIQPVTEMEAFGVSNAMFCDPFGYIWMLHQVHREISFEERCRAYEEMNK